MSFLYFLPRVKRNELDKDFGLSYALKNPQSREVTGKGPDGGSGVIIANQAEGLGYFASNQRWIPHPTAKTEHGNVWVGLGIDDKPGPGDLLRDTPLPGKDIELADGNYWHIPLIREFRTEEDVYGYVAKLPRVMGVDPEELAKGNYQLVWNEIDPKYSDLIPLAEQYYEWFSSEDKESEKLKMAGIGELTKSAVRVLSVNYRISLAEATLLNLFDSAAMHAQNVLNYSVIDWDNLQLWLKKNVRDESQQEPDGSNSDAGLLGDQWDPTDQPSLTI